MYRVIDLEDGRRTISRGTFKTKRAALAYIEKRKKYDLRHMYTRTLWSFHEYSIIED